MKKLSLVAAGSCVMVLVGLTGCADSPEVDVPKESLTVESCGLELNFDSVPERAVTLSQAATEVMLELGLADQMVGTANLYGAIPDHLRQAYDSVPELAAEIPPLEVILDTNPDFIYGTIGSIFTPAEAGDRAEHQELGVNVFLSNMNCENSPAQPVPATFDAVFDEIRTIGEIFEVEEEAEAFIATQQAKIDAALAEAETLTAAPSVLWFFAPYQGVPYVAGADGIPDNVNKLTGTTNVFSDLDTSPWPEVTWEAIVEADPDVIVVADLSERGLPGDSAQEKIDMLKSDPASASLTAVIEDRFIIIPGPPMDPSVRSVDVLVDFVAGLKELGY